MTSLAHAALTDRGRVRPRNEDRWYGDDRQGLYVVSDGINDGFAGDLAVQVVVDTLPPLLHRQMRVWRCKPGNLGAPRTAPARTGRRSCQIVLTGAGRPP